MLKQNISTKTNSFNDDDDDKEPENIVRDLK